MFYDYPVCDRALANFITILLIFSLVSGTFKYTWLIWTTTDAHMYCREKPLKMIKIRICAFQLSRIHVQIRGLSDPVENSRSLRKKGRQMQ